MAKNLGGRPSKYEKEIQPKLSAIRTLVRGGHNEKDIASFLGIAESTLYEYKKKYNEFSECFKKEDIVDLVENTFINRLTGKYKAEKEVWERVLNQETKEHEMVLTRKERYEIPFNDGAYIRYLTLMRPERWLKTEEEQESFSELRITFADGSIRE